MPLFRRKQDKQKASSPAGKDSTSLKISPSTHSNPQSPDAVNGDIGVPSSVLSPVGLGKPPRLVLSTETLNTINKHEDASGLSPASPMTTSSRLSKTLQEILRDKDALLCFLHFMESQQAERFIRFWLDANSFCASTLTRLRTHSLQSVGSSALMKRRTEERSGDRGGDAGQEEGGARLASAESVRKADGVAEGEQESVAGGCDRPDASHAARTSGACPDEALSSSSKSAAANPKESQRPEAGCEGKEGKPCSLSLSPVSVTVTPAGVSGAEQEEHSQSSSTDQSLHSLQDSGIAMPSEGDFVTSPSCQWESLADTESVDTLTDEDVHGTAESGAARSAAGPSGSHPKDRSNSIAGQSGSHSKDSSSSSGDSAEPASADSKKPPSVIDGQDTDAVRQETVSKPRSLSAEEMREKIKKSIERDAVSIFSKYIAKDAPQPIGVDDTLRGETIHKICREDKQVDPECFVACQEFVVARMEREYYKSFMDSEFHCKHQVNVLTQTGGQVYLADVLYNEHALCYFMEFMEQEGAQHLMQFWMAADNFQQQLIQQGGSYDGMQAQCDAMVLYDRFFSLQATTPLGFDDKIRFEVEGNICREAGPLPDCFSTPRDIVLHTLEKVYFQRYMSSEIYYRYLSDLISTVQMAQDFPVRRHRRQASDASSEHSAGSQSVGGESISTRNTLLAAASSRGGRGKVASPASTPSSSLPLSLTSGRIEEHLSTMDCDFLNPESLWKQPHKGSVPLSLGSVNALGQFVSEFDPDPDNSKKKGGGFFKKNKSKEKEQEQMAVQVAQMILNDVANMTQMGDACARIDDAPSTTTSTTTSTSTTPSSINPGPARPNTLSSSSSQSLSTAFSTTAFFEPPPS